MSLNLVTKNKKVSYPQILKSIYIAKNKSDNKFGFLTPFDRTAHIRQLYQKT